VAFRQAKTLIKEEKEPFCRHSIPRQRGKKKPSSEKRRSLLAGRGFKGKSSSENNTIQPEEGKGHGPSSSDISNKRGHPGWAKNLSSHQGGPLKGKKPPRSLRKNVGGESPRENNRCIVVTPRGLERKEKRERERMSPRGKMDRDR